MNELDYFSRRDEEMVNSIWNQFGKMNSWKLRQYTHEHCKEWSDPRGSRKPIEEIDVLRAVGIDEQQARHIAGEIQHGKALCRVVGESST